jgi:Cu(I)/Ag(I) efflux system membrane protein CusA/SilA
MALGEYVEQARAAVQEGVKLPPGYSITWSGQYEYMLRVEERMKLLVPFTLLIIFILLYLNFRNLVEPAMVMVSLPFALIGGFWYLLLLEFNLSVAVSVGFIALAGVAAEFGIVMLVYLDQAIKRARENNELNNREDLEQAILYGAVQRVRPKAMTVAVLIAGLLPIMLGTGTGSEVMQRIAAPMLGGMITAPLLSLFVIPVLYSLWKRQTMKLLMDRETTT